MLLKPTIREKKRYIAFRIEAEVKLSEGELRNGLQDALLSFVGEFGYSKANPKIIQFNSANRFGIMRCVPEEMNAMRTSLALINSISGKKVAVRLLGASGTLRKLRGTFLGKVGSRKPR
ncbi:MAG: Rpp14/Pop5 family protein [Candidatus Micrarchaeota archaeon]